MLLRKLSERFREAATNNPKIILSAMMLILLAGLIMIFVKRSMIKEAGGEGFDKVSKIARTIDDDVVNSDSIFNQKSFMNDAANVMQMNKHLNEVEEILQLEGEVKRILEKEVLTREDSLFLKEVSKKLTKLNYEN